MDEQQKQTILDLPKVIAVGISSPAATFLTSRFGVAGTLLGLALSAVILTVLADALKVYLARAAAKAAKVPHTVAKVPVGLRAHRPRQGMRDRLGAAFAKFSFLPSARARWRSILVGSVAAAGISFLVGLGVVTGLEMGVGKSLSCWVWDECPVESSTVASRTPATSTMPSIFGGGQGVSSIPPEVQPLPPQQPAPGAPGSPIPQPEDGVPGPERPDPVQPGQRGGLPEPPEDGVDRQPSSSSAPEGGDRQSSPPGGSEGGEQRSPADESGEGEQRSPADGSGGDQQQEGQENRSSGSDRETQEPTIP